MMHSHKTEVLIVGAGPVGLTTGLALAERDIHVTLIDKARRTNLHSYCLALHPHSLRLLHDLGVAEDLIAEGMTVETIEVHRGHQRFATINLNLVEGRYPFILVLPQSMLENALETRLKELGIQVEWDHEANEIREYDQGVGVSIDILGDVPKGYPIMQMNRMVTGGSRYVADFLVGADGYHSLVRRTATITYQNFDAEEFYFVYEFASDEKITPTVHLVLDDEGACVFWPIGENRGRWSFQIPRGTNFQSSLENLKTMLERRAPWFRPAPSEIEWYSCVRFENRCAERFGREHIWLAGDAAHLTSPIGAQSMNNGLREGMDLAWRIFEILRNNASHNLLEIYNTNCLKTWDAMMKRAEHVRVLTEADPWAGEHRARLASSMPASGKDLDTLLLQMGLETI